MVKITIRALERHSILKDQLPFRAVLVLLLQCEFWDLLTIVDHKVLWYIPQLFLVLTNNSTPKDAKPGPKLWAP